MRCPQARALWLATNDEWELPEDDMILPSGTEWLIQLLTSISEVQRARILLFLWRIWHNHNEMTHAKPCPSIEGSRRFLLSYAKSLMLIKHYPEADINKRKNGY
jgi:hypothetical protein